MNLLDTYLKTELFVSLKGSNLPIFDFLENNLYSYARKYFCTSPHMCTYMAMSEQLNDGTLLFSGEYTEKDVVHLNYTILGLHRYALQSKRNIIPYFLLHTPELAGAFNPYIKYEEVIPQDYYSYPGKAAAYIRRYRRGRWRRKGLWLH